MSTFWLYLLIFFNFRVQTPVLNSTWISRNQHVVKLHAHGLCFFQVPFWDSIEVCHTFVDVWKDEQPQTCPGLFFFHVQLFYNNVLTITETNFVFQSHPNAKSKNLIDIRKFGCMYAITNQAQFSWSSVLHSSLRFPSWQRPNQVSSYRP